MDSTVSEPDTFTRNPGTRIASPAVAELPCRGMFPVTIIHQKATQAGLEYLVIGGHAVNAYCEPRVTLDVDFLICKEVEASWCKLLEQEGFQVDYRGKTFLRFTPPYGVQWRLDLMMVSEATFSKMAGEANPVELLGIPTRIPKPEHVIALKLHAIKHGHSERFEKDFIDLIALIRNSGLDLRAETGRKLFDQFGTPEIYEKALDRIG